MQAIKAIQSGQSATDVAKVFGVSVRSVFKWLAQYAAGGQNALLAKQVPGRPPKVGPDELKWVAEAVRDKTPDQFKFEFGLWTLSLIGELIYHQFKIRLTPPSVLRIMRILGYTPQQPLRRAWQQDPVLVQNWQHTEFPAIAAQAKACGGLVLFADEAGMRSDYHAGTTWAPVGKTPIVANTGRRFGLNMLSAISPRGDLRFMIHEGKVTFEVFRAFLKQLLRGIDQPIFLIVDEHPIHRARLVKEFVDSTNGKLWLFFLPPYSPQLNPDEQVWGNVKTRVSKQKPINKIDLHSLVRSALCRLQKLPAIISGFFKHPDCRYISI